MWGGGLARACRRRIATGRLVHARVLVEWIAITASTLDRRACRARAVSHAMEQNTEERASQFVSTYMYLSHACMIMQTGTT